MLPKVIIHSEVSLDGHIDGYEVDQGIYYSSAARFGADMVMVGADTVLSAVEEVPPEEGSDLIRPEIEEGDPRPFWVIPDSRGRVRSLHVLRRWGLCKDIIVLVSKATPKSHMEYLKERGYDHVIAGDDHVDYRKALEALWDRFGCRVLRTDSGGTLNNILLEEGLVDVISIIVSPVLVGAGHTHLFRSLGLQDPLGLELERTETLDKDHLQMVYRVLR
jgi:2,5-diamino-6-(ribosylamino)-4(3H)-pyrimidinone 5'-phosphate reductase